MEQEGVLVGLPMPVKFRPAVAMTDEELIAFSRRNKPYQIERLDAQPRRCLGL